MTGMRVRMGIAERTVGSKEYVLIRRVENPGSPATLWIMGSDGDWTRFAESPGIREYVFAIDDPLTAVFTGPVRGLLLASDTEKEPA